MFSDDNPNHLLFADRPEIQEYLVDRMFFIGTEEQVQERFAMLFTATQLDGVWLHAHSVEEAEKRRPRCSLAAIHPGADRVI